VVRVDALVVETGIKIILVYNYAFVKVCHDKPEKKGLMV
jgi:hypothetical protein